MYFLEQTNKVIHYFTILAFLLSDGREHFVQVKSGILVGMKEGKLSEKTGKLGRVGVETFLDEFQDVVGFWWVGIGGVEPINRWSLALHQNYHNISFDKQV